MITQDSLMLYLFAILIALLIFVVMKVFDHFKF